MATTRKPSSSRRGTQLYRNIRSTWMDLNNSRSKCMPLSSTNSQRYRSASCFAVGRSSVSMSSFIVALSFLHLGPEAENRQIERDQNAGHKDGYKYQDH